MEQVTEPMTAKTFELTATQLRSCLHPWCMRTRTRRVLARTISRVASRWRYRIHWLYFACILFLEWTLSGQCSLFARAGCSWWSNPCFNSFFIWIQSNFRTVCMSLSGNLGSYDDFYGILCLSFLWHSFQLWEKLLFIQQWRFWGFLKCFRFIQFLPFIIFLELAFFT